MTHPKVHIYRWIRPRFRKSYWLYLASTVKAANREEALVAYLQWAGPIAQARAGEYRAEYAATHGYHIEEDPPHCA